MRPAPAPVTVGVDIGTSSVKAVAADDEGTVVAQVRVPHPFRVPRANRLEHDVEVAWRVGPRVALAAIAGEVGWRHVRGVSVSAMVPSLAAVDDRGHALSAGLLYGDERGRAVDDPPVPDVEYGELRNFARWLVRRVPNAAGLWPAQATANHALAGAAVLDTSTAASAVPLFDFAGWDATQVEAIGAHPAQLPRLVPTGWECGRVDEDGPPLAAGCIDALAEQIVAGADVVGDVLVLLGSTLVMWAVTDCDTPVPGYWTVPHTTPGRWLVGGPSNAGGLFHDWVARMTGAVRSAAVPERVPVWAPYPRGERTPIHDPARRAVLADLDLTHDPAAVRRAAREASGFAVRQLLDMVGREVEGWEPRRIVASGGGIRDGALLQAVADAIARPVECVGVAAGAALGSAWLARIGAGLEDPLAMSEGRRWATRGRTVDPDPAWTDPVRRRYERFRGLSASSPRRGDERGLPCSSDQEAMS